MSQRNHLTRQQNLVIGSWYVLGVLFGALQPQGLIDLLDEGAKGHRAEALALAMAVSTISHWGIPIGAIVVDTLE